MRRKARISLLWRCLVFFIPVDRAKIIGMSVRITIDIPDDLYEALRRRAKRERTSIRALIIDAIDRKFRDKCTPVLAPPVSGTGKPGPSCPDRENLYDLLFV